MDAIWRVLFAMVEDVVSSTGVLSVLQSVGTVECWQ